MQSTLAVKPGDDPCDDVALAPEVAHVVPSDEEISSVLHQAARHRIDAPVNVVPDITVVPPVQPADTIVRPVLAKDMLAKDMRVAEDRVALHIAPPVEPMVRPEPANDIGRPRKARPLVRAFLALLSTLIVGFAAATWKSYGDGASKMIAGFAALPVVGSSQPEKPEVVAQPVQTSAQAEAVTATPDQPAPAAQAVTAAPSSATPSSAVPASPPNSAQLLQSMSRDLAALGQQVEDLKSEMAQMKAGQQQASRTLPKASEPAARPKTAPLPPRPIAAQPRRSTLPVQSYAPSQATATQPAVPQVATAPYRSAPQANAAPPVATTPYYPPPQRYYGPPPPELPPQAATEPPFDQEAWVPRPPMPVR